jgi:hypothetical protein
MYEMSNASQAQRSAGESNRSSMGTDLDDLYFAHGWLDHAVFKVVADYTFLQVKTHAAAKFGTKLNTSNGRTKYKNWTCAVAEQNIKQGNSVEYKI